jgi:AcrR family transcriptional regulator
MNPVPPSDHRQLSDADRRREGVLAAARAEFAEWGYHGATTAAIAKKADISRSYIYALFPSKKDLFLACQRWNHRQIMGIIDVAAEAITSLEAQARIHQAYVEKVEHRPHFLFRLQATAAAASDADIAAEARRSFIEGFEKLVQILRDDEEAVKMYISLGLFADVAMAIRLPRDYWSTLPAG